VVTYDAAGVRLVGEAEVGPTNSPSIEAAMTQGLAAIETTLAGRR